MYLKVTLFHISSIFVAVLKANYKMSLVFVTNRVLMNSEKKHVNFDCFITCLNEGPYFS